MKNVSEEHLKELFRRADREAWSLAKSSRFSLRISLISIDSLFPAANRPGTSKKRLT